MRLPVVPSLSTKEGTSNKNARLTNMLKETKASGDLAVIRPGLVLSDTYSGLGAGLIPFDGRLLTIYDDTVTDGDLWPWPLDSDDWASGTTYSYGSPVWYFGTMYFSLTGSNTGNTPSPGSAYWTTAYYPPTWDSGTAYAIGDLVSYNGVLYYSLGPSNTGNNPASTPMWSTTAPGASRYKVNLKYIAGLNATTPGPECASVEAAAFAWFATATTFISCATKGGSYNWVTYVNTVFGSPYYYAQVNQWTDAYPFDCSGAPANMGIVSGGRLIQTV